MKLIVLNAAQAELEEAQAYYLQHATPRIAAAFVADYENSAGRLLAFPLSGTRIQALAGSADASFPLLDRLSSRRGVRHRPCRCPPAPPARVLGRTALSGAITPA